MIKHNNSKYWLIMGLLSLFLAVIIITNLIPGFSIPRQAGAQIAIDNAINTINPDNVLFKKYKVLHVMSYHSPWEWADSQFEGFKAALNDLNVQYDVIQMDTKQKSDETWKQQIAAEAIQAIKTRKPDLIFTSDDDAQRYVAGKYVNSPIPVVFSGVNAQPEDYGFKDAPNVAGVLERMHFAATLRLLKKLVPDVQKVVLITDNGQMWPPMIEQFKQQESQCPDIRVIGCDTIDTYKDFQKKILEYQNQADAVGFLGVFEFKNENNENVPQDEVMRWLGQNNKLPDFSFWKDRVAKGTLCAVTVSGYAQGYQAGLLAHSILIDSTKPSSHPMVPTEKGIPMLNLETANRLGIRPDAETLLAADVVRKTKLE
jgi:ABC-type uncharacterized transport system substrate-binding protein